MNLQRFLIISLLSLVPLAMDAKFHTKKIVTKQLPAKRNGNSGKLAGKYVLGENQAPSKNNGLMAPVREIDTQIKQKEQDLQRLTQEIANLKIQRVKLYAETMNQHLNSKQRRIDQDEQVVRNGNNGKNGNKRRLEQTQSVR